MSSEKSPPLLRTRAQSLELPEVGKLGTEVLLQVHWLTPKTGRAISSTGDRPRALKGMAVGRAPWATRKCPEDCPVHRGAPPRQPLRKRSPLLLPDPAPSPFGPCLCRAALCFSLVYWVPVLAVGGRRGGFVARPAGPLPGVRVWDQDLGEVPGLPTTER